MKCFFKGNINKFSIRTIVILFVFVLFASNLCGQSNKRYDINKIEITDSLLNESYKYLLLVNIEQSLKNALIAEKISNKIGYTKGKYSSHFLIAQNLIYLGKYKESLSHLSDAEGSAGSDPKSLSEICRIRGQIYYYLKLEDASINEFQKGLSYIEKIKSSFERNYLTSLSYENLAFIYSIKGDTTLAYSYIVENSKILKFLPDSSAFINKINNNTSLADFYTQSGEYLKAKEFIKQAHDLTDKFNFPYKSRLFLTQGDLQLCMSDTSGALTSFYLALKNLKETNIKGELPLVMSKLANLYSSLKIEDSASFYNNSANSLELELMNEKMDAVDTALKVLEQNNKKNIAYILLAVFIILVAIFGFVFISCKRAHIISRDNTLSQNSNSETNIVVELIKSAKIGDREFLHKFNIYFPFFLDKLGKVHPNLTESEIILCSMIYLNFSSKEIAQSMYIQHRSVQTKKSRLRKKLQISSQADITDYLKSCVDV